MKIIYTLLLLIITVSISSCSKDECITPPSSYHEPSFWFDGMEDDVAIFLAVIGQSFPNKPRMGDVIYNNLYGIEKKRGFSSGDTLTINGYVDGTVQTSPTTSELEEFNEFLYSTAIPLFYRLILKPFYKNYIDNLRRTNLHQDITRSIPVKFVLNFGFIFQGDVYLHFPFRIKLNLDLVGRISLEVNERPMYL